MDDKTKTDKMLSRKDGRVGYVIFNNPERHNAVSLEMWARTAEILDEFARDDEVRVVVITGAGGKSFVSGADISRFESERSSLEATKHYNATVAKANESIYEFGKPTIAMIRGYCIGGGLGLLHEPHVAVNVIREAPAVLVPSFVRSADWTHPLRGQIREFLEEIVIHGALAHDPHHPTHAASDSLGPI